MRIAVFCFLHVQLGSFGVHFSDKAVVAFLFLEFVAWTIFALVRKKDSASPHCQGQASIVAAGQHESVQQLQDRVDFAFLDVG
jgi:hypothetical protein